MQQPEEYVEQAQDCRKAAQLASTFAEQERLYQMAEHWEQLARQRATYLHLESILAELLENKPSAP
ncbi:MAG TPA: hypothetical protein VLC74_02675 [Rhizomicrobium sp.]|nr:hypothetical protein [Rhizomicrobium sp.]